MKKKKTIFLNLFKLRFPITAVASILHRISGFLLFFIIPFSLWVLQTSLKNEVTFESIREVFFHSKKGVFITWTVLLVFIYHFIAGLRHLLMDWGWFEKVKSARYSALFIFIFIGLIDLILGKWLW